jgi:hypothetical protein
MGREDAIMSPLHSYFCTLLLLFHNLKQRLTLTNVSEMLRVRGDRIVIIPAETQLLSFQSLQSRLHILLEVLHLFVRLLQFLENK